MSEQLVLEGTNLCISEDAFEKFQATSMYEETECITLPSIVPIECAQSECGEDNKVTCSDDVVVHSKLKAEVNIERRSETENPSKDETVGIFDDATMSSLPSDNVNAKDQKFIHHKKRGRKKKVDPDSSDPFSGNESESKSVNYVSEPSESIEDIQNFIQNTSPTYTPNRRGRKPLSNNTSSDDLSPSKRRVSKESISEPIKDLCSSENPLPRRRGRPRKLRPSWSEVDGKTVNNVSSSCGDETPTIDSTVQPISNDTNVSPEKTFKKRGRPRKMSKIEQPLDIEISDATDEQLSGHETLPDVSKSLVNEKRTYKRGRPRKNKTSEAEQSEKEKNDESNLSPLNKDDDDDLSLSKLSKLVHKNLDTDISKTSKEHVDSCDIENYENNTKKHPDYTIKNGTPKKLLSKALPQVKKKSEIGSPDEGSHEKIKNADESLSKLTDLLDPEETTDKKEPLDAGTANQSCKTQVELLQTPPKRNPKVPIMSDFEYNLDSIVNESTESEKVDNPKDDTSLLVEDVSKRPTRKKVRQNVQYHDESDEDPFANVELSDDEPIMRRKGKRYNSDDEYFPGEKKDSAKPISSDSDSNPDLDSDKKSRKRKLSKKLDSLSPKKRGRKSNLEKTTEGGKITDKKCNNSNDIELVNDNENTIQKSNNTNSENTKTISTDLESFLAKKIQGTSLKIKKVSPTENADKIVPLNIPVIDPNEPKKFVEISTQTKTIVTSDVDTQTGCPYHFPMKDNVTLTSEQSEKACELLDSIVTTTADLGKLMTQKSEDFIKKKINTEQVTNTVKMDYCVKKSFLLFKLAKNNLEQMEKDLATQYEQFLGKNDLLKYREIPKQISPNVKDNDSDCEIIEESVPEKAPAKSIAKFNAKTVFLNKELSIKIAKKSSEDKNVNIKKHSVWINDSVMVKKVKPTQSFLAQDSRNKKPPDQNYVTIKMVSDFFEDYYRKKSLATCALFTSPSWLNNNVNYTCHYFVVAPDFAVDNISETEEYHMNSASGTTSNPNSNQNLDTIVNKFNNMCGISSPETLFTLCTEILRKQLPVTKSQLKIQRNSINHQTIDINMTSNPQSLIELCVNVFSQVMKVYQDDSSEKKVRYKVLSLKTLCRQKVSELLLNCAQNNSVHNNKTVHEKSDFVDIKLQQVETKIKSLLSLCVERIQIANGKPNIFSITHPVIRKNGESIKSLFSLCVEFFRHANNNNLTIYPLIKQKNGGTKSVFSRCFESNRRNYLEFAKTNEFAVKPAIKICDEFSEDFSEEKLMVTNNPFVNFNDNINDHEIYIAKKHKRGVKSLFALCVEFVEFRINDTNKRNFYPLVKHHNRELKSLFSLSFESVRHGIANSQISTRKPTKTGYEKKPKSLLSLCIESINRKNDCITEDITRSKAIGSEKRIKTLFSTCVEYIQRIQISDIDAQCVNCMPKSLKHICFEIISGLLYNNGINEMENTNESMTHETLFINNPFTINSVNTLSEEAFHNLQNTVDDHYYEDYDNGHDEYDNFNNDDFATTYEDNEEHNHLEDDWTTQVRMKELRSCVNINNTLNTEVINNEELHNFSIQIKTEPIDDVLENMHESVSVKIEPIHGLDEMTMIPEIVVTKTEMPDNVNAVNVRRTYSVDTFEEFVRKNKLIQGLNENAYGEVYSQSSLRIRQQYEPDFVGQNDSYDGLLVPHAFTNIYTAKDCLMASSSDDGNSSQNITKKKPNKRKPKPKKQTSQPAIQTPNKDTPIPDKDKPSTKANVVDELTKKMKDKILQEEKETPSSDSDYEELPLSVRRKKAIAKESDKKSTPPDPNNDAIQCNDVDSTEQISNQQEAVISHDETTNSSSSTSVSQNDLPNSNVDKKKKRKKKTDTTVEFNGPMELLECEPTIHECNDHANKSAKELKEQSTPTHDTVNDETQKENLKEAEFQDRHGWSCYPIDTKDAKLYQNVSVLLDKLPESFVEIYFQYQDIDEQNQIDREIDRLTNVNTLNRASKDKVNVKPRTKVSSVENNKQNQPESSSIFEDTDASKDFHELLPSDDEGANIEDEPPAAIPMRHGENSIAKNSLMNDESEPEDTVADVKQEPADNVPVKKRPGPKSKTKAEEPKIPDSELVLTADKMMEEELTLLHAPVTMNEEVIEPAAKREENEIKTRKTSTRKTKHQVKSEEDSSSEEEKQWVTTKEKLLKKLKNKQHASLSDAKRAKMVSEFIEKRGIGSETRKVSRGKGRGSRKKLLEREKQLKVLSQELYGESSDTAHPRKSYFSSNYKGRRNIRKVIDKKSLKQSTVKAIMEEFERKRRLNERQNKLREHLGCEENVNVLVINDEVCLEYDFEEDRPVVAVHQFFTKVMKAHQYEGVKFMWDACFESVCRLRAGHPGAGCILAHCMGLGKTLQVLALLHTVLTHPGVGMKRVLVCCPLSTVLNWVDEIHKWIGPVTDEIKVFELSKLKKTYERAYQLEDWYNGGGIFIIGYELFRSLTTLDPTLDDVRPTIVNKIRTALLDPGPDIVVCDEGHLLKNDCSVLAVAMSRVATKRRIVLTGTPMQNNLREYYCMVNFIKPNLLGSYAEYSNRFANPIMNGQHRDSSEEDIKLMKTRTHILHKILEGCLQRQEASVLYPYLPKKHEYTVFIPLTKCQWDLYKHYIYTYCKQNKQGILKDFHILQKIWSHPQVLHNFHTQLSHHKKAKEEKLEDELAQADLTADDIKPSDTEVWWLQYLKDGKMLDSLESSNKFLTVFRILEECVSLGDKVLIFSTSLFCLDSLEFFLKAINKWSLGQEYYRLDGSVPAEVRHKWCREFNAGNNEKTKLFLISTRAGCLGLNMTAANRVIILDTSWNPAHDLQSIFRVYRFGQKKDCFIYRLVAMGTMEQKIYERSVTKQAVACRVVDEQQIDRHYNSADLAELYRLDEAGGSVAGGVAAGVRDVALLRVARDGPVHAVHEHDSLLRASEPALPEHERAAAWHQFQLERAAEQKDNESTAKKTKVKNIQKEKPNIEAETPKPDSQEPGPSKPKEDTESPKALNNTFFAEDAFKNYIVDRVVNNLIQHDLPNMRKMKNTAEIVEIVRHIVSNVPATQENKERVSAVITENLLRHIKVSIPNIRNTLGKNYNNNDEAQNVTEKSRKSLTQTQKKSTNIKEIHMQLRSRKHSMETPNTEQNVTVELEEKSTDNEKEIPNGKLVSDNSQINPTAPVEIEVPIVNLPSRSTNAQTIPAEAENAILESASNRQSKSHKTSDTEIPTVNIDLDDSSNEDEGPNKINQKEVTTVNSMTENNTNKQNNAYKPRGKEIPVQVHTDKNKDQISTHRKKANVDSPIITPVTTQDKPTTETGRKKRERKEQPVTDNSIVLSDDDDVCEVQSSEVKKPAAKRGRPRKIRKTFEDVKQVPLDPVPLHPSLLSNTNFITIVANRYLEDNPTLDEHAATLAARYSTLKAKREIQYTGASITSGPLYDIAVKVLGQKILHKLHSYGNKVTSSKTIAEVEAALRLEESACDLEKTNDAIRQKSNAQPAPPAVPSTSKNTSVSGEKNTIAKTTQATDVVPVELFKGPSMPSSSRYSRQNEECILPDDDSRESHNKNQTTASSTDGSTLTQHQKTNPILSQRLLASKSMPQTPSKKVTNEQDATAKKLDLNNSCGNVVLDPTKDMTICLDSDDEEPTPVTTAAMSPVPVALTSVATQKMSVTSVTSAPANTNKNVGTYKVVSGTEGKTTTQQKQPLVLKIRSKFVPRLTTTPAEASKPEATPVKTFSPDHSKKLTLLYSNEKIKSAKQDAADTGRSILKKQSSKTIDGGKYESATIVRRPSTSQAQSIATTTNLNQDNIRDVFKNASPAMYSKNSTKTPQEVKASYGFNKTTNKQSEIDARASKEKELLTLPGILAKKKALLHGASASTSLKDLKTIVVTNAKDKKTKEGKSRKFLNKANNMLMIDLTSGSSASSRPVREASKGNYVAPEIVTIVDPPALAVQTKTVKELKIEGKTSKSKSTAKSKSSNSRQTASSSGSERKRPSTSTDPEPSKKKRIDELTLQDFNLDDLDDIIELE